MSHEDRLKAAFDDLERRVGEVPHRSWNPGRRPRLVAALAGAAAVVVVIGGVALFQLLPGEPPTSAPPLTQPTTVTTVPPSTSGTIQAPPSTQPGSFNRYRVDTEKVAADTDDPFLNVRWAAGAGSELLAKLPPGYRGLAWTGATEATKDGATWYEVELLHPVAGVNPPEPLEGRYPRGWVNAAYLLPLPDGLSVGTAELAPCPAEGESGLADGPSDAHVYSLETARVADGCTRIVVGFGGGTLGFTWDDPSMEGVAPLDRVPAWNTVQEPWPLVIDLPATARVWPGATDDDGVYVARSASLALQLVSLLPSDRTTIRSFDGWLVIDLEGGSQALPLSGAGIQLTASPLVGAGSVELVGIARPFEANLGVTLADSEGNPVTAVWSGSSFLGTIADDSYAVMTNDWTEAWGQFALRADGLEPGDYVISLSGDGGSDNPRTLKIPFTVDLAAEVTPTEPSAPASTAAAQVVGFAQGGSAPLFSDTVTIRLGAKAVVSRSRAQMETRQGWVIEAEEFNGYVGPFDILGIIANRPFVRVSEGVQPRCAGPAIDYWPAAILVYPPVNLEPIGIDSCLQWYRVSLVLGAADPLISEIVLDLWEP